MKWILQTRKIKDLKPHSKNPRTLSKYDAAHLSKSLEKFGLIDKPIISGDQIIGGHQRISILKKLRHKEVECYVSEEPLSQEDIDELNICLNRNQGEWDFDILANQWDGQQLLDYGFTPEELCFDADALFQDAIDEEKIEEPVTPKTKLGDIYQLGDHYLACGDSTDQNIVERLFNGKKPIVMVTDPPYGVNYDPQWRNKSDLGIQKGDYILNDERSSWKETYALFPGQVAYVWHSALHSNVFFNDLIECGFEIKGQIIWAKQHFALSRGDYNWQHEPCFYAIRKGCNHNWQGSRKESTLWEISSLNSFGSSQTEDANCNHAAQKPLECMARPIRNNTAEGESVYDPFLGSGTTLIAAASLNRKCYGIELEPKFCDMIVQRWVNYRKKQGKDAIVKRNSHLCEDFI